MLEPLLTPARACLEHRHAYVRKNAVFAVSSIYHHSQALIPDAPELLQAFLETESDPTCKRNAFAALSTLSHDKALEYLSGAFDGIPNADELLQLVELEFIRKDAVQNSQNKVCESSKLAIGDADLIGPLSATNLRPARSWSDDRCLRSGIFANFTYQQSGSC